MLKCLTQEFSQDDVRLITGSNSSCYCSRTSVKILLKHQKSQGENALFLWEFQLCPLVSTLLDILVYWKPNYLQNKTRKQISCMVIDQNLLLFQDLWPYSYWQRDQKRPTLFLCLSHYKAKQFKMFNYLFLLDALDSLSSLQVLFNERLHPSLFCSLPSSIIGKEYFRCWDPLARACCHSHCSGKKKRKQTLGNDSGQAWALV